MRVALLAHGTRGDVQPALAIGEVPRHRGHEVRVCVNADLAEWASRSELQVIQSDLDVGCFLQSDEVREILAKGKISTLVRRTTADERRVNGSIVEATLETARDADVVAATLGMALRGAALHEATGIPAMNLFCAPLTTTAQWASLASPVRDLRAGWANRLSFRAFHGLLWKQSKPNVDDLCDRLGAQLGRPDLDALPTLHAFSARLAPRPPDWGPEQHLIGPALPGERLSSLLGETSASPALLEWLDAGPPPVYFGFGSMPVLKPRQLLEDLAAITQDLGVRGLIGAGWTDYGVDREALPDRLFLADSHLDHQQILPRCTAAVHHGGSGTTASVTTAGIPRTFAAVLRTEDGAEHAADLLEQHVDQGV